MGGGRLRQGAAAAAVRRRGAPPLDAADARACKTPSPCRGRRSSTRLTAYEPSPIFLHAPPPRRRPRRPARAARAARPPRGPAPPGRRRGRPGDDRLLAAAAAATRRLDAALRGGDVDAVDAGRPRRLAAAAAGARGAVLRLLAAGVDPTRRDARGRPPYRAAKDGPTRERGAAAVRRRRRRPGHGDDVRRRRTPTSFGAGAARREKKQRRREARSGGFEAD